MQVLPHQELGERKKPESNTSAVYFPSPFACNGYCDGVKIGAWNPLIIVGDFWESNSVLEESLGERDVCDEILVSAAQDKRVMALLTFQRHRNKQERSAATFLRTRIFEPMKKTDRGKENINTLLFFVGPRFAEELNQFSFKLL